MYIVIQADGHSNSHPDGDMAVAVVIKESESTKCRSGKNIIPPVAELAGRGTQEMAEFTAVLRGLGEVKKLFMNGGNILACQGIMVYNDNKGVHERILGSWKINDPGAVVLNAQIQELRKEFIELNIPLKFKWISRNFVIEAHDLANRVLYGDGYDKYAYNRTVLKNAKAGDTVIPLSIFTRKEYENLTIAEALVMELIDQRRMTRSQVAQALGRKYDTIRTQYNNAKKKAVGLTPPRKLGFTEKPGQPAEVT